MYDGARGGEEEDEEKDWFRHPWENEPADDGVPTGPEWRADSAPASDGVVLDGMALLAPLAEASAALARLQARLESAGPAIANGLRARLALREAAGFLFHQHGTWVHPLDLGLRDAGLTGSVGVAAVAGRLRTALPATTAARVPTGEPAAVADDLDVLAALRLARLWRRLAEHRSWIPLADFGALQNLLAQLGGPAPAEDAIADWLARFAPRRSRSGAAGGGGPDLPGLVVAAEAAQAWAACEPAGQGRGDQLSLAALFLAACLWRRSGMTPSLALPVWSATPQRLQALVRRAGPAWLADFLAVVADGAQRAGQELTRLQAAAEKAAALRRTARSLLPAAASLALSRPVLTARGLAGELRISPQAALALLKDLVAAGVLREATGRASWRAFMVG